MTEPNVPAPTPAPAVPEPALAPETQAILNSSTLIVGPSQTGKSTLGGTLAEYVWAKYHKVTLYYLIDGGGFPIQVQELVNRGIIRLWKVRTRSAPGLLLETLHRASLGWWPRKINPKTGEAAPNVDLVPPVTVKYHLRCPSGHEVVTAPTAALLPLQAQCPTCKTHVTMANAQVTRTAARTKGFEQVGAMFLDGISSSGAAIMDDLAQRELGGEKGAIGGIVGSGDMRFGSNNRAHYGFAQGRVEQMVLNSMTVPNLVIPPVWTALLQEGSDEGGLQIKGPLLPGQAKTAVATQWFGDTLETRLSERDGKRIRAIHLSSWLEPTPTGQFRHICGVRSFPGRLPPVIEEVEGVDAPLTKFNLGYFYDLRAEVAEQIRAEYAAKYASAPGLPSGDVEYGEPAAITQGTIVEGQPAPPVGPSLAATRGAAPMAPPRGTLLPPPNAPQGVVAAPVQPAPASTAPMTSAPPKAPAPRRSRVSAAVGVVTAPSGAAPPPQAPASGVPAAPARVEAETAPAPAGAGAEIPVAVAAVPPLLPTTKTQPTLPGVPSAVLAGPAMAPAPPPPPAPTAPVRSAVPPPPGRRPQ